MLVEVNSDGTYPTEYEIYHKKAKYLKHAKDPKAILYDGLNEVDSVESMKTLMDKVYYRAGTYGRDVSPFWYTEYVGVYPSGDFRVDTDIDDEAFKIEDVSLFKTIFDLPPLILRTERPKV